MKKFLQAVLAFTLVFTLVGAFGLNALAEEEETNEEAERKVVVHYHRWDGDYAGRYIHTWSTDGTDGDIPVSGESEFGGTFEILLGEDAGDEIGLILKYGAGWDNGHNDRDGLIPADGGDKANKAIIIRDEDGEFTGFNEDGVKNVFVYEGSNEVIYEDDRYGPLQESFGLLRVVYYDPNESYEGWNIWNWGTGTGGTVANDDDGAIEFVGKLDVDGGFVDEEMFRVAHILIAEDADDEMGFIVRTNAWDKQWEEDLFIDISDIKGEGSKTVFYIGQDDVFYDDFDEFEAIANVFEIEDALLEDLLSFRVEFNKGVRVMIEDEEGQQTNLFDPSWFTVLDASGNEVAVSNISYAQGEETVTDFMLIFEDELTHAAGPYTLVFNTDPEDGIPTEYNFSVPNTPPTITIVGSREVTLELGDRYSLPTFRAVETVGGETMPLYNVRVKEGHGYLSTRDAGIYELVLEATDRYGNHTEQIITVTVIDPCDDTAHLNGLGGISNALLSVFIGLPLAAGAFFLMRRNA